METMLKKIVEYDYERVSFLKKLYFIFMTMYIYIHLDLESVHAPKPRIRLNSFVQGILTSLVWLDFQWMDEYLKVYTPMEKCVWWQIKMVEKQGDRENPLKQA